VITLLTSLVAQVLHIVLMGAAAPTLIGVHRWIRARLVGRVGPPLLQPWRDLIRLHTKQIVLAEGASGVTSAAPAVCVAATAIAACLVPSFALGMIFAPFADLLAIAGLLALARCSAAFAAMDAGAALGGLGASRSLLLACLAEPALLLVLFVLALLAGSLNLDLIAAMQIESGTRWHTDLAIALAATVLVALVGTMRQEELALEFSGTGLALFEAADALRLLVWFNLIGAMFLPFGMAPAGDGPTAWAVGLACWLGRTLILAAALALLNAVLGRIRMMRAAHVLCVAVLFGLLAATFLLAETGTA
jgi:formate hydrogenlyase subunit 4